MQFQPCPICGEMPEKETDYDDGQYHMLLGCKCLVINGDPPAVELAWEMYSFNVDEHIKKAAASFTPRHKRQPRVMEDDRAPVETIGPEEPCDHSERMFTWRERHSVNQREAAALLGCTVAKVSGIEQGRGRIQREDERIMERIDSTGVPEIFRQAVGGTIEVDK